MRLDELKSFYIDQLKNVMLPFWMNKSIDEEYGGIYTCFDNFGLKLLSTDKYTWSQGRMVWIFSKLSTMDIFTAAEKKRFFELAKAGAYFLMNNCLLENGNCTFLMERNGRVKMQDGADSLDTSVYADCFAILGVSAYARISKDKDALAFCKKVYSSITRRIETNTYKAEPYPTPRGYKEHGIVMSLLLISTEFAATLSTFGDDMYEAANSRANYCLREILDNFADENYVIHEMKTVDNQFVKDKLLGMYANPGHTIEDMWFVIHQALISKDTKAIEKAGRVVKSTFQIGWDEEYGGIQLFASVNGGKPSGDITGIENEKMVQKVQNDWDSKLWWPHSETLYTSLLLYRLTGDEEYMSMYEKVHEYVFKTFPNPDKEIGEWIQIRDRKGEPIQKVVALPVKDPFHVMRNMIQIIELTDLKV